MFFGAMVCNSGDTEQLILHISYSGLLNAAVDVCLRDCLSINNMPSREEIHKRKRLIPVRHREDEK